MSEADNGMMDMSKIPASLTVANIDAGHISMGIINAKTGKRGVKHLYSDAYRERWPQDQYPERYQEDIPVD